jgi:hypothetical protein
MSAAEHHHGLPKYRVVQYVVNPFSDFRVPVAVVVRHDSGETESIAAPHIPEPECLGNATAYAHIRALGPQLARLDSIDTLPEILGPHFTFGSIQHLPKNKAWRQWLLEVVLRRDVTASESAAKRAPRLSRVSRRLFASHGVDRLVQDNFRLPTPQGVLLEPVTHWADGGAIKLLMEPLSPKRTHPSKDMREAAGRLTIYRYHLDDAEKFKLVAYTLPGLEKSVKQDLRVAVAGIADVYDIADPEMESAFIKLVRQGSPPLVDA